MVALLKRYTITSAPKADAPGVYVEGKKIASLGLRVRRGCSFHGVAINVDMDLSPFLRINPCGYNQLEMTQIVDQAVDTQSPPDIELVAQNYLQDLTNQLGIQALQV